MFMFDLKIIHLQSIYDHFIKKYHRKYNYHHMKLLYYCGNFYKKHHNLTYYYETILHCNFLMSFFHFMQINHILLFLVYHYQYN